MTLEEKIAALTVEVAELRKRVEELEARNQRSNGAWVALVEQIRAQQASR